MSAYSNPLILARSNWMTGGKRFHGRGTRHEAERMAGRDTGGDA